jgi:putative hydrolase of HD superfamily
MDDASIAGTRAFLRGAGALKDTLRSGFTIGGRPESVAKHSWRLCLLVVTLAPSAPDVDVAKALKLAVIHDLGEAIGGDAPAPTQTDPQAKTARERADLATLLAPAPDSVRNEIAALWEEYEAGETAEARYVKALDKLETVTTHAEGMNPPDFDYRFNLGYGHRWTSALPAIAALRAIIDDETAARAATTATGADH